MVALAMKQVYQERKQGRVAGLVRGSGIADVLLIEL